MTKSELRDRQQLERDIAKLPPDLAPFGKAMRDIVSGFDELRAERDDLLAILRDCEWVEDGDGFKMCPWCFNGPSGHKSGCKLAKALANASK